MFLVVLQIRLFKVEVESVYTTEIDNNVREVHDKFLPLSKHGIRHQQIEYINSHISIAQVVVLSHLIYFWNFVLAKSFMAQTWSIIE